MDTYPNTASGVAAAIADAGGDKTRLMVDGSLIRLMPPALQVVPAKVTRRQFKQGLTRLGIRSAVEAWRAGLDTSAPAGQDAADWYDDSNDVERNNPMINTMAAQFGLSAAQVDAAFIMMASL